jgi:hypothetical protein
MKLCPNEGSQWRTTATFLKDSISVEKIIYGKQGFYHLHGVAISHCAEKKYFDVSQKESPRTSATIRAAKQ